MSNFGSADGIIEIILEIDDKTGKIHDSAVKTMDGTLFDLSKLEDPDWWIEQGIKVGKAGIKYTLNSMNGKLNYGNVSNFICGSSKVGVDEYNEKLVKLAGKNKNYNSWIKNADTLIGGAESLVALSNAAFKMSEGIQALTDLDESDSNYYTKRGIAIANISTGLFSAGSKIASNIPGIVGDAVSTILDKAADTLEKGVNVIIGYISKLEALEAEIEEICSDDCDETITKINELNEFAEAYSNFLDAGVSNRLSSLNNTLAGYESAVNYYESNKGVDINGDGKIGGKPYDPNNHGGQDGNNGGDGNGGGNDADNQFNDGENRRVDPIVVDLNNDGFAPSSLRDGVNFDLDANGMAERINWIQGDDAILAYDKNEDGIINDGTEVFGDNTVLESGKKAINGFEALAEFDSNGDGVINAEDERFGQLLVWQDFNRNGISEENELKTLDEVGIESIDLEYSNLNSNTASGTVLGNVGTFRFKDGSESHMAEYWVLSQKFNTVDTNPIEIPENIAKLPNVNGMGNVYSLHKAMTLDSTGRLIDMVGEFSNSTDINERKRIVSDMLVIMSGAENVADGSRGAYVDAKKMTALEALLGQTFSGQNGANPNSAAAPLVKGAYDTIVNMYYCELLAGTSLKDCLSFIAVDDNNGIKTLDLSVFCQYLRFNKLGDENGETKIADAASYLNYLDNYYFSGCFNDFRTYFENNGTIADIMNIDRAVNTAVFGDDSSNKLSTDIGKNIVYGMDGNDIIAGSSANDKLYGGSGDDVINAGAGDDMLNGGSGNDILNGGAGNDTYTFNYFYGNDVVNDTEGSNTLIFKNISIEDGFTASLDSELGLVISQEGASDSVTVKNFISNESMWDIIADDSSVKNVLYVDTETNELTAGNGFNIINGSTGNDKIKGGNFLNVIYGDAGNDDITGGTSTDIIYGGAGNDTYHFSKNHGNDIIFDTEGDNLLVFGDGLTSEDYHAEITYNGGFSLVNDETGDKIYLFDMMKNPEKYDFSFNNGTETIGSGSREILNGTDADDYLEAGDGFNIFYGGDGDDTLAGGADMDFMYGGDGDDLLLGRNGVNVLFGEGGNDIIYDGDDGSYLNGGDGDDMLYGGGGADVLDGGAGNDYLQGDHGNDTYIFGKGYDVDTIAASSDLHTVVIHDYSVSDMRNTREMNNDLVIDFGTDTGDRLILTRFFDYNSNRDYKFVFDDGTVLGQYDIEAVSAPINGTDGDDYLYGTNGADVLDGGAGNDSLNGGDGEDTYIFAKGYDQDTINEWGSDHSFVDLRDINSDEITVSDQWGSNLLISVNGTDDVLTVSNFKWGQATYTFRFADGAEGYVDKNTWQLVLTKQPDPAFEEEDMEQTGAELLDELYSSDASELADEMSAIISDVTESASISGESGKLADMTDLQAMLLAENMSAFGGNSQISDGLNIGDITSDASALDQLLISSSVQ